MKALTQFSIAFLVLVATGLLNEASAQNNISDDNMLSFVEKFSKEGAFIKQIKSNEDGRITTLIYPASEGLKIIREEEAVHLQYFDRKFEDEASPIYEVTIKNVKEKNYIKWMVQKDIKDGIFVVERSVDKENFSAIGYKNRIGTDINVNLLYSWIDKNPIDSEIVYYRILAMGEDGSFNYSPTVKVENVKSSVPLFY